MSDDEESQVEELIAELKRHVLDRTGNVVLVIGSGCSIEETDLPPAGRLSKIAYDRLVAEGVLEEGDCANPRNLEALADTVIQKTGNKRALVERLRPILEDAPYNRGHLIAGALIMEGAVSSVLTVNFDLAMTGALRYLGAFPMVCQVRGAQESANLGRSNLIYLHGTVDSPWDQWILTKEEVEADWIGHWRAALAARVLTTSAVVFAGIGTSVGALVETLSNIAGALQGSQTILVVDPEETESGFFKALDLPPESHWKFGWLDFTEVVGESLHTFSVLELIRTAEDLLAENEGTWASVNLEPVKRALKALGLVDAGLSRSRWLGNGARYEPWHGGDPRAFAHLAVAVASLAEHSGTSPWLTPTGAAHFDTDNHETNYSVMLRHGGGTRSWAALLGERRQLLRAMREERYTPTAVIGGGFTGQRPDEVAAHDLTGDVDPKGIVEGADAIRYYSVDEVMNNVEAFFNE